jgi:putative cell wall-binding protein
MNPSAQRPRPLTRFLSLAAIGGLAAAGIAIPSAASAATQTVTIDPSAFHRYVGVYDFEGQTISRGTTTITVALPEAVDSVDYDDEFAILDETSATVVRQGTTATISVPSSFWTSHRVNSTFDLSISGSDEMEDDYDITDFYDATFTVTVGAAGGGAATLSSDAALLDIQTAYEPSSTPVPVEPGDTLLLEAPAGFWTDGPALATALVETDTTEESVEISDDGSTATVIVGPPSRSREAQSPSGFAELTVLAMSDFTADDTETVWVTMPLEFPKPTPVVERVSGTDRYAGAAAISAAAYPDGSDVVYIAAGTAFPDALSAAPAAAHEGAPLLLTLPGRLPASIETEIARLDPDRIVVIGGTAAVSDTVFDLLETMAPTVDRIAGANRFEVSRAVADYAFGAEGSQVAFFATGVAFPDALSASSAAGAFGAPVILVRGNASTLDDATFDTIESLGIDFPLIAGGTVSVSEGIEEDLDSIANDEFGGSLRLAGSNRYLTSLAIARFAFDSTDQVFIASGANFPDALAGAAWAGAVGGPLYIAPTSCVPDGMVADIGRYAETRITILGGTKSLTPAVEKLTRCGFGDMPEDSGFFVAASDDAVDSVDALDGLEATDRFDAIQGIVERDEK